MEKIEKTLTIIIPAFNESKRILKALNDIDSYVSRTKTQEKFKVIVVDDGSLDNTREVVKNWIQNESKNKELFSVISYVPNRGKGYAVQEGFFRASTELVLYTDADGACPIQEVEKLLPWASNGYDIVVGSRIIESQDTKVKMSFLRRVIGRGFHLVLSLLNLAEIKDTQCGFKLFKSTCAKKLAQNQKCFNYSFDIEYLFLAKKFGFKLKEVPVNWYHASGSKVNLFKDSIKMFIEVLKIRFVYKYNQTEIPRN